MHSLVPRLLHRNMGRSLGTRLERAYYKQPKKLLEPESLGMNIADLYFILRPSLSVTANYGPTKLVWERDYVCKMGMKI